MRRPTLVLAVAVLVAVSLIAPVRGGTVTDGVERTAYAQAGLPPVPAGWPNMLQLGMASAPGDAVTLKATAPFGFRYQYLAGGVNTNHGWATWDANGGFVTSYIDESVKNGTIPVFSYYMLLQSTPATGA